MLHKSIAREAEPQRALVRWGVWSRQFLWRGKMGEKIGGEISEFPEVFLKFFSDLFVEDQMIENEVGNRHQTIFQNVK